MNFIFGGAISRMRLVSNDFFVSGKMKDSRGTVEVDESNLINNDGMDESDMNGSSTLVISESALSINGDDSRDSCNQLSIDTGGPDIEAEALEALESVKPSIRIAKGLTKDSNENHAPMGILAAQLTSGLKRKQTSSNNGVLNSNSLGNNINGLVLPMVKKQRPNATENDQEILGLEKEIRALQWLARRKEREWDQVISLLKQKEERLMKAQRAKVMIQVEAEHLLTKYKSPATSINLNTSSVSSPAQPTSVMMSTSQLQPVIVPQQQVLILPSPTSMATSTPTSRQIQPKPATAATLAVKPLTSTPTSSVGGTNLRNNKLPSPVQQQKPSNGVSNELQDQKTLSAVRNLQKAASNATVTVTPSVNNPKEESKKNTPNCQGCGKKKSEFVCAGCSNRWYCSRECQVKSKVTFRHNQIHKTLSSLKSNY